MSRERAPTDNGRLPIDAGTRARYRARVTRSIAFLSDLGVRDEFVGVCHAVMDRISPGVPVILDDDEREELEGAA